MESARLRQDARFVSREKGRARSQLAATRRIGQAERGGHDARTAEEQRRNVTVCLAPGREHFALGLPVEAAGAVQTGSIPVLYHSSGLFLAAKTVCVGTHSFKIEVPGSS